MMFIKNYEDKFLFIWNCTSVGSLSYKLYAMRIYRNFVHKNASPSSAFTFYQTTRENNKKKEYLSPLIYLLTMLCKKISAKHSFYLPSFFKMITIRKNN